MADQLWAPWRLEYVTGNKSEGCALCAKQHEGDDTAALIIARSAFSVVMMNLYPYTNGHLMVVPKRHVADITDLNVDERHDLHEMQVVAITALRLTMNPDGFNLGVNLGSAAGAGIAAHLHVHVVPRWSGDTNFMPVIAEVKVMPQHLQSTFRQVLGGFQKLAESPITADVDFSPTIPTSTDPGHS